MAKPYRFDGFLAEIGCGLALAAFIIAVPILVLTPAKNLESWIPIIFGFLGTVVGAVIGAITALAVYRKQKFERQITDAYGIWIAVQVGFSDLITLRKWLEDAVIKASKEGMKYDQKWQIVEPFVSAPPPISLPNSQLAVFAEAKEYQLLQNLVLFGLKHRGICEAVTAYTKYRTEMNDIMRKKIGILKPVGAKSFASFFTPEEMLVHQSRFAELESLLNSLETAIYEDVVFGNKIILAIGPAGKKYFGESNFPSLRRND